MRAIDSARERTALAVLIVASVLLRIAAVFRLPVNSDEPQHLHVAWAWGHGLLPYRDVFDNHTPLFSFLLAPVLALAGERADIVQVMRFAMFPIVALALVATWTIAARIFSRRVAWWAVALLGANADFLRASLEYRTDQLWMALWLATLALLAASGLTVRRAFVAGIVGGLAIATSLKTMPLLTCLLVAVAWSAFLAARAGVRGVYALLAVRGTAFLAGLVVLPVAVMLAYAGIGAWAPFWYGVVGHNVSSKLGLWGSAPWRPLLMVAVVPLIGALAREVFRRAPDAPAGARRAALLATALLVFSAFELMWPLVVHSDLLPSAPLFAVFAAAALLAFARTRAPRAVGGVLAFATCVELAFVPHAVSLQRDRTVGHEAFVAQVLALTGPSDEVMDAKGESVFRPRPCFLGVETITEDKIRMGVLPDTFPSRMVRNRTAVVGEYLGFAFPARTRAFIDSNYVRIGEVSVAGRPLPATEGDPAALRAFTVTVPLRYALVTPAGAARGVLDGAPYAGPCDLVAGRHVYAPAPGEDRIAWVWARAVERGLNPFVPAR